jgi:hypothetical protein
MNIKKILFKEQPEEKIKLENQLRKGDLRKKL